MIDFNQIPKFVVNLDHRTENMDLIKREMEYMGWDFERFSAINRNSYMGCTLSHLEVIKIAKKRNYKRVMVIEDDCLFMPYAKSLLDSIENETEDIDFHVLNLSPTLNRHLQISKKYSSLLDLTDVPPKKMENYGETFATNLMLYDEQVYDKLFDISLTAFTSGDYYFPIDGFLAHHIYPQYQSYCPILPVAPQRRSYSDVSHGMYNNYYTQVYNWNEYSPVKLNKSWVHQEVVEKIKDKEKHISHHVS